MSPLHPIAASLRRRRISFVCHMTPCDRLPSIVASGAVLSLASRRTGGIAEPDNPHYWGSPGKEEELSRFVVCSFMPPWWMCRARQEELVIILMDAEEVCCGDGVVYCPTNSAYNEYPAADIKTRSGVDQFDACFPNPDTYQAANSEIFVPDQVPVSTFRALVFCDDEARDFWLPAIKAAADEANPTPAFPDQPITVATKTYRGFKFPGDWTPTNRMRL
jgi:hypothetical protein